VKRFVVALLAATAAGVVFALSSASGAPPLIGPTCHQGETLYTIQATDSPTLVGLDVNADGAVCVIDDTIKK
jgi:hypothetical protein